MAPAVSTIVATDDPARLQIKTFREVITREVHHAVRRSIRTVVGLALIVVGLAGLVLPVVPGLPILFAGLAVLGSEHPVRQAIMRRLQRWGLVRGSR